jgi:hypothetical protein
MALMGTVMGVEVAGNGDAGVYGSSNLTDRLHDDHLHNLRYLTLPRNEAPVNLGAGSFWLTALDLFSNVCALGDRG